MVLNWKNTIIRIINMFNMSLISFLKIDQIYDKYVRDKYILSFTILKQPNHFKRSI